MSKIYFIKNQILIVFFSILLAIYLLGFEYINPINVNWLAYGDLPTYQIGWKFFRFDEWRFPLLSNPNYGIYLNSNLIFSDSIPLFAIIFKIFSFLLPVNFQYFSIWVIVCIYLQLLFSYLIIFKITNDYSYSLVSSIFFGLATIFIHRVGINLSLFGQWIILMYFYSELISEKRKFFFKNFAIILSVTIHFYFTMMLIIIFFLEKIYDLILQKISLKLFFSEIIMIILPILFLMYTLGYFSIGLSDGLGWGYGHYNLNLNSFINPLGRTTQDIDWSNFLPTQKFQNGEIEGFSYLGLSGLVFLILFFKFFFIKNSKIVFEKKKVLLISVIFFVIAISNNLNFGNTNLIEIELNKYIYAMSSLVRASGRFIWPIFYLIFIIGLISIFRLFPQKKIMILTSLLILQIIDTSNGLKNYKFGNQYLEDKIYNLKQKKWDKDLANFNQIRLLEPKNQSNIFQKMTSIMLNNNFSKSDIIYLARVNRDLIVKEKYKIQEFIYNKNLELFDETIYVSDNINLVKFLFLNYEDNLYYYKRNDLWFITKQNLSGISSNDHQILNEKIVVDLNLESKIYFNEDHIVPMLGFDQSYNKKGISIDGYKGVVVFKIKGEKCKKNTKLKIEYSNYYQIDYDLNDLDIEINGDKVNKIYSDKYINTEFNCLNGYMNTFEFSVKNSKSLFDSKKGLNRKKRSIIIKSFDIL